MRNNFTTNQTDYMMLKEPIQLVSTHLDNNIQQPSSQFEDKETQENVFQSWEDDKTAFRFQIIKFILATVITIGYFGYSMINYMDPVKNSITRSSVTKVSEVAVPLFYFYAGYKIFNLDVSYVQNGDKQYGYDDLIVVNAANFHYDHSVTQWTLVDFGTQGWIILLVPPYGAKLKFKDILRFSLLSYTPYSKDAFDGKDTEENLLKQLFEGDDYGIFWTADTPNRVNDVFNVSWMPLLYNRDNLEYAFVSTTNAIQLSLTEEIDEVIKPKTVDYYYTALSVASLFESNQTTTVHKNLDIESDDYDNDVSTTSKPFEQNQNNSDFNRSRRFLSETTTAIDDDMTYCFQYTNNFLFYYSPKGGGLKTEITTSKLKSFTDVLSATGGFWGPSTTSLSILFSFLLSTSVCFCIGGCAKNKGLSNEEKAKVALYLQELGVITSKQFQDSVQFKKLMNK